ncbi:transposase [Mycobacterium lacus]|uniref:Transposase n=1 Tax=Mycobacterium lacus TaxID=169765 RepID=A0A7I7NKU4_9MYCO|nr:transposase [Mycobacterium lacus]BBX97272.1 hypothetical protein MLAC_25660 [Mycobacterium lacus]
MLFRAGRIGGQGKWQHDAGTSRSRWWCRGRWAKLCPRTIESGPVTRAGKTGKANPHLKGALGEAATAAAKTNTVLGQRYRRLVKRRGKLKALVAVTRSILVIVWHLLVNPATRFHDLAPDYYTDRIVTQRRLRNYLAQRAAMGYRVTIEPAALRRVASRRPLTLVIFRSVRTPRDWPGHDAIAPSRP